MSIEKRIEKIVKEIQKWDIKLINFFLNMKFIKFLIIGGTSTILNYLTFFILFQFQIFNYLLSSTTGYLTGLVFGYFLNKYWSFESKSTNHIKDAILYLSVYLTSLVVGLSVLYIAVEILNIHPLIANIISIGITTILNFTGLKLIVFKNEH